MSNFTVGLIEIHNTVIFINTIIDVWGSNLSLQQIPAKVKGPILYCAWGYTRKGNNFISGLIAFLYT